MNSNEQVAFIRQLSQEEQAKVKGAIKFFNTTLLGNPSNKEQKSNNEFSEYLPK